MFFADADTSQDADAGTSQECLGYYAVVSDQNCLLLSIEVAQNKKKTLMLVCYLVCCMHAAAIIPKAHVLIGGQPASISKKNNNDDKRTLVQRWPAVAWAGSQT